MAPKMKAAKLGSVEPTDEELKAARQVLRDASAGDRRSKNASLIHFLKTNPGSGNDAVKEAKGLERDKYLEKFLVLQMRYAKSVRSVTATREISSSHRKMKDLHWWSWESMDLNMGPLKGKHWRDSGKLPTRADMLTNSWEPDFKEYGVPHDWQQLSLDDFSKLTFESTSSGHTAEEMDVAMNMAKDIEAVRVHSAMLKGGDELQQVEKAPDGELKIDEMTAAVNKSLELENRKYHLTKFQEFEFSITTWVAKYNASQKKSSTSKYCVSLMEDLTKHKDHVGRISGKMMKLACADESDLDSSTIPQLLEDINKCCARHDELKEWAVKFGLATQDKAGKRKKK
jgi:hypothetical protein